MIKPMLKNLCSSLALLSALSFSVTTHAVATEVVDNKNESTQRFLMQDLKTFLAMTELKRLENETVLRLMLPPNFDKTVTVATRISSAEKSLIEWQDTLVRDTANYNIQTPADKTDAYSLLAQQKKYCDDSFICDLEKNGKNLLASTLLGEDAFKNDNDANYAYLYVKWLTNPNPIGMLSKKKLYKKDDQDKLSDEGVKNLAALYLQTPALTLAQNSLLAMHADRQRFSAFDKGLNINEENDKGASLLEVMSYEVNRRMSDDWYKQMNQMSEEAISRELAYMKAFELFMRFQEYKRFERMEALLAAQVSAFSQLSGTLAKAMNTSATANPINFGTGIGSSSVPEETTAQ